MEKFNPIHSRKKYYDQFPYTHYPSYQLFASLGCFLLPQFKFIKFISNPMLAEEIPLLSCTPTAQLFLVRIWPMTFLASTKIIPLLHSYLMMCFVLLQSRLRSLGSHGASLCRTTSTATVGDNAIGDTWIQVNSRNYIYTA